MAKQKKVMESEVIADGITRDCNTFEAWFIENGKTVAWACVAIIVIVAVVFTVIQIRKSADAKAYSALASATTEQQIQDALKQYPKGTAAAEARFRLAGLLIKAKNNKAAIEQLALIADDADAMPFTRARAILDAGYLYENDGKTKDALSRYEKAASARRCPSGRILCRRTYAAAAERCCQSACRIQTGVQCRGPFAGRVFLELPGSGGPEPFASGNRRREIIRGDYIVKAPGVAAPRFDDPSRQKEQRLLPCGRLAVRQRDSDSASRFDRSLHSP